MARKWVNQDSTRNMVDKYNESVDDITELQESTTRVNEATQRELSRLDNKINSKVSTKQEIGLEKVNNTSDLDKPVSIAQAKAIQEAVSDKLTSLPTIYEGHEDVGYVTLVSVKGTKLVITV